MRPTAGGAPNHAAVAAVTEPARASPPRAYNMGSSYMHSAGLTSISRPGWRPIAFRKDANPRGERCEPRIAEALLGVTRRDGQELLFTPGWSLFRSETLVEWGSDAGGVSGSNRKRFRKPVFTAPAARMARPV